MQPTQALLAFPPSAACAAHWTQSPPSSSSANSLHAAAIGAHKATHGLRAAGSQFAGTICRKSLLLLSHARLKATPTRSRRAVTRGAHVNLVSVSWLAQTALLWKTAHRRIQRVPPTSRGAKRRATERPAASIRPALAHVSFICCGSSTAAALQVLVRGSCPPLVGPWCRRRSQHLNRPPTPVTSWPHTVQLKHTHPSFSRNFNLQEKVAETQQHCTLAAMQNRTAPARPPINATAW